MKKEDFMGALSLYLSMSQASRAFAVDTYSAAITIDFERIPHSLPLVELIDEFCEWVSYGVLKDKQPAWLHFKEYVQ